MAGEVTLINDAKNTAANTAQNLSGIITNSFIISAFSVVNDTGINSSYKIYIYDAEGNTSGPIAPLKFVTGRKGYDIPASIIGHIVPAGGSIWCESSVTDSLMFRATGRQT